MSEYLIQGETLTAIADAVRSKTGETSPIPINEMADRIGKIDMPSGSSVKIAIGTITTDGGPIVVEHGLGVVPDIIYVGSGVRSHGNGNFIYAYGFSGALMDKTNYAIKSACAYKDSNGNVVITIPGPVDGNTVLLGIRAATTSEFTVSYDNVPLYAGSNPYNWVAIAGLT